MLVWVTVLTCKHMGFRLPLLAVVGLCGCNQALDPIIEMELRALSSPPMLTDGDLHIVMGGTGTLSTDADRVGASVAVVASGRVLLFDAGPGSTRVVGSSGVPLGAVTDVFLTHLHSDHFSDLGELTVATELMGRTEPITLHGPVGIEQVAEGFAMAYAIDHRNRSAQHPGHLDPDNARLRPDVLPALTEPALIFDADGIQVRAFPVNHAPVEPAYGYRVSYGGREVVISGDTGYHEPLSGYARGADVLIHEAMDKDFAEQIARVAYQIDQERTGALIRDALPNHSTADDAGRIAAAAGVDTLVLTHVSPPLISPLLARRFVNRARAVFDGEVLLAEDGMRIDLEVR